MMGKEKLFSIKDINDVVNNIESYYFYIEKGITPGLKTIVIINEITEFIYYPNYFSLMINPFILDYLYIINENILIIFYNEFRIKLLFNNNNDVYDFISFLESRILKKNIIYKNLNNNKLKKIHNILKHIYEDMEKDFTFNTILH